METIDITRKGAALEAAAQGRFDSLPIYDRSVECAPREAIEALQLRKLQEQVAYTYRHVPYYRRLMDESGCRQTTCAP